jgi:hypothetical protein
MSVPIGFAGMFFLLPGLIFEIGVPLQIIAGLLMVYVARLSRFGQGAWLFGLVLHAGVLAGALYYVPSWPTLLGVPLALANLYSLIVLVVYRRLWTEPAESGVLELLAS